MTIESYFVDGKRHRFEDKYGNVWVLRVSKDYENGLKNPISVYLKLISCVSSSYPMTITYTVVDSYHKFNGDVKYSEVGDEKRIVIAEAHEEGDKFLFVIARATAPTTAAVSRYGQSQSGLSTTPGSYSLQLSETRIQSSSNGNSITFALQALQLSLNDSDSD